MKKMLLLLAVIQIGLLSACKKSSASDNIPVNLPHINVPEQLQGTWMYGNFSLAEYWSQDAAEYLGNAFTMAIAFKFAADGTYEQYFTSSSVTLGVTTYHHAVTKGTLVLDEVSKTFTTRPSSSHYRRTRNKQVMEERDLRPDEMSTVKYFYKAGTEPNGTKAIYLALGATADPLIFLKK